MSLKGGYKIIDLKGIDVTQSAMMVEGVYESIESNYGKPLLISGIVIDGVEKDDVFVQATLNGSAYEFELYGYTIQVQDTDAVGVKNIIVLEDPTTSTTINLKNGDWYYLKDMHEWKNNTNYTFRFNNVKGISFNEIGYDPSLDVNSIFEEYSFIYEDGIVKTYFNFVTATSTQEGVVLSVINNIIYITKTFEY